MTVAAVLVALAAAILIGLAAGVVVFVVTLESLG